MAGDFLIKRLNALKGNSFVLGMVVSAVAADFSMIGLWNPAASGKILALRNGYFSSSTGQNLTIGDMTAQFATGTLNGRPKLVGGAAGVGQVSFDNSASATHFQNLVYGVVESLANAPQPLPWDEPIMIPAGHGFGVWCSTVNTPLVGFFDWDELAG